MSISGLGSDRVQAMHDPVREENIVDELPRRRAEGREQRLEQRRERRPFPYSRAPGDEGPGDALEEIEQKISEFDVDRQIVQSQMGEIEQRVGEMQPRLNLAYTREDYADELQRLGDAISEQGIRLYNFIDEHVVKSDELLRIATILARSSNEKLDRFKIACLEERVIQQDLNARWKSLLTTLTEIKQDLTQEQNTLAADLEGNIVGNS